MTIPGCTTRRLLAVSLAALAIPVAFAVGAVDGKQAAAQAVHGRPHVAFTPEDFLYGLQWSLDMEQGIHAPRAWDVTTGSGVRVAVVDTGITSHPDLDANVLPGYDFVSDAAYSRDGNGRDPDPTDPGDQVNGGECGPGTVFHAASYRGTKIAGVIAAVSNFDQIVGVAPNAKIVPVRALGKCGGNVQDVADAITWASGGTVAGVPSIGSPVEVIALGAAVSGACPAPMQAAIDGAVARGTVVVAAAGDGNGDAGLSYPGNCNNVINVASVTRLGARAPYSNHGTAVDVAAPGGSGGSEDYGFGVYVTASGSAYEDRGSALAMANVAGTVALMQSAKVNSPATVEAILERTAGPLHVDCPEGCGAGVVDASVAVRAAQHPVVFITPPFDTFEGDERTHPVEFRVRLSEPLAAPVTFDIATANGTALYGFDYVPNAATAQVIPAGETSHAFTVLVKGETAVESDETFHVDLANVVGAAVDQARATHVIRTDDCRVLENGVALTGLSGTQGLYDCYRITVPAYSSGVTFTTTGAYEHVRAGQLPDVRPGYWTWDCNSSYSCTLWPYLETTYYVVFSATDYSGATLKASFTPPPPPQLSIADASLYEGNQGEQYLKFTVTLSSKQHGGVSFDIATSDIEAQSGSDYTGFLPTAITIPPGDDTRVIRVPISGDFDIEPNETFAFDLQDVVGANVVDGHAIGTILNDDGPLLRVGDVGVAEGDAGTKVATFTVALNKPAPDPVVFDIATRDLSATAGSDYVALALAGESIPAGQLARTFSVTINGDTTIEGNERIALDLHLVSGASIVDGEGYIDVMNDDGPTLSVLDASRREGSDGSTYYLPVTVKLSKPATTEVTFNLWLSDGTANADDYYAQITPGYISPGQTETRVFINVRGDTAFEPDETINIELRGVSGATRFDWRAVATILNDDGAALYVSDARVSEGDDGTRSATFTVGLDKVQPFPVSYTISTRDGTALAGSDYGARTLAGQTIPAGMLSRTFTVPVNGDIQLEDTETFAAQLSGLSAGAVSFHPVGTGYIINDDSPGLSVLDASAAEGAGTMQVTVRLSEPASGPVTFALSTAYGTANPGFDYQETALAGQVIPAGETTRTVSIPLLDDAVRESNETFLVNLGAVDGATRTDWQGVATIYNDDGPTLSIGDAIVREGDAGTKLLTFTVFLSQASTQPVSYSIATFDISATAGSDYDARSLVGETIPAGMLSRTFSVTLQGDTQAEANETFLVAISRPSANATLYRNKAIGTIGNDD